MHLQVHYTANDRRLSPSVQQRRFGLNASSSLYFKKKEEKKKQKTAICIWLLAAERFDFKRSGRDDVKHGECS